VCCSFKFMLRVYCCVCCSISEALSFVYMCVRMSSLASPRSITGVHSPGAAGLPYCCKPLVCVPASLELCNIQKKKRHHAAGDFGWLLYAPELRVLSCHASPSAQSLNSRKKKPSQPPSDVSQLSWSPRDWRDNLPQATIYYCCNRVFRNPEALTASDQRCID